MCFQLSRSSKGSPLELEDYFTASYDYKVVDKSAYSKARLKLDAQVYDRLNAGICNIFYHQAKIKKWKGLIVKSIDGSTVVLPNSESLEVTFGRQSSDKGPCMGRFSFLYDVLNKVVLANNLSA